MNLLRALGRTLLSMLVMGFTLMLIVLVAGCSVIYLRYGRDVPQYQHVIDYNPAVVTRIHTADGQLMREVYSNEQRVFIPISAVPEHLIQAFLSAEDDSFYQHNGVDLLAFSTTMLRNVSRVVNEERLTGASTITMQVAKNFVVGDERSVERKIREIFVAWELESILSKDEILELYLNEIFLGNRSYGVAAAAMNYFGKSVDELTISEAALIASLPKAPTLYDPTRNYETAVTRRNITLNRMAADGYITEADAAAYKAEPIRLHDGQREDLLYAPYYAEEVRRQLIRAYGMEAVNGEGLSVRTAMDPEMQAIGQEALRQGLMNYDRRYGYRGPVTELDLDSDNWREALAALEADGLRVPNGPDWDYAVVIEANAEQARILTRNGEAGSLRRENMNWAGRSPSALFNRGAVIIVEPLGGNDYALQQVPEVNGALVALNPHSGRVLTMVGGFSFEASEFNRAVQAERQPGSTIKPFVFLAALDQGYTPGTPILDSPVIVDQVGSGSRDWRPTNYDGRFQGRISIIQALERSRNLATVQLALNVGMDQVARYARVFGADPDMEPFISNSLGTSETTLLNMVVAYAKIVNGGFHIEPTLIDRVQDRQGQNLYVNDPRDCLGCAEGDTLPSVAETRTQIADPVSVYQLLAMMRGVVERGTAARTVGSQLDFPVAGKTGTTDDFKDAWFIGFTPDLVVGVYVGFDTPRSLGRNEAGGTLAAPIFTEFMRRALVGKSIPNFRLPLGYTFASLNADGTLVDAIDESKAGLVRELGFSNTTEFVDDSNYQGASSSSEALGGLY